MSPESGFQSQPVEILSRPVAVQTGPEPVQSESSSIQFLPVVASPYPVIRQSGSSTGQISIWSYQLRQSILTN
jgi:hypothetical protein